MITLKNGRKELFQWDIGQVIVLTDGQIAKEAHFKNAISQEVLVIKLVNNEAAIPNILLQKALPIEVLLYYKDEDESYTISRKTLTVIPRLKPTDYVYTETEVFKYETILATAQRAAEDVVDAKADAAIAVADASSAVQVAQGVRDDADAGAFKGDKGEPGEKGDKGDKGDTGLQGIPGEVGKSAYESWLDLGNEGTEQEYLASLKGDDGYTPIKGVDYFDGIDGKDGEQGIQGPKGDKGEDGYTPIKGVDYVDGIDGEQGIQGEKGADGKDGKTPIKGTDYYTEADKQEMVNLVLEEIPTSEGVAELITPITYEELKTLRDNAELVVGMLYRITDYVTTSIQEATQSAGHQFDIIVRALDEKTLDEEAKAIQSENDEYFANSNLTGWQVWYTLDNDTSKYAWADEVNGKGIIYRLIDENGNDAPYDFKNIKMQDANNSEDTTYYYTFDNRGTDLSLNGSLCFNNEINKYIDGTQRINRIIFKGNANEISTNFFDFECYNNTLGGSTDHMKFGRECYGNVFGGMNHLCTFDTKFRNNVVGSETQSIQVGQGASNNNFANCIYYSTFGNYFRNNKVCKYTYYSSFGHYVQNFIMGKNADELGQYMRYLTIENGVTYVNLYKTDATTKTYMENIRICSGTNGTSSKRINIEVEELAQKYAIAYGNNSKGELRKYCVADLTDIPTYEDGDEVSY